MKAVALHRQHFWKEPNMSWPCSDLGGHDKHLEWTFVSPAFVDRAETRRCQSDISRRKVKVPAGTEEVRSCERVASQSTEVPQQHSEPAGHAVSTAGLPSGQLLLCEF